jgi:hypothetical protein
MNGNTSYVTSFLSCETQTLHVSASGSDSATCGYSSSTACASLGKVITKNNPSILMGEGNFTEDSYVLYGIFNLNGTINAENELKTQIELNSNNSNFLYKFSFGEIKLMHLAFYFGTDSGYVVHLVNSSTCVCFDCKFSSSGSLLRQLGGVYMEGRGSTVVTIDFCDVVNISSAECFITCRNTSILYVSNSTFNNMKSSSNGSAISVINGECFIEDNQFTNCTSFAGGAVSFIANLYSSFSVLSCTNCSFTRCKATSPYLGGGAIAVDASYYFRFITGGIYFFDNEATGFGNDLLLFGFYTHETGIGVYFIF